MDYYKKKLSCLSLILAIMQILALSLNEQALEIKQTGCIMLSFEQNITVEIVKPTCLLLFSNYQPFYIRAESKRAWLPDWED